VAEVRDIGAAHVEVVQARRERRPGAVVVVAAAATAPGFPGGVGGDWVAARVRAPRQRGCDLGPGVDVVVVQQRAGRALTPCGRPQRPGASARASALSVARRRSRQSEARTAGRAAAVHRVEDAVFQPEEDVTAWIRGVLVADPRQIYCRQTREGHWRLTVSINLHSAGTQPQQSGTHPSLQLACIRRPPDAHMLK
jgi:hypothetical protein